MNFSQNQLKFAQFLSETTGKPASDFINEITMESLETFFPIKTSPHSQQAEKQQQPVKQPLTTAVFNGSNVKTSPNEKESYIFSLGDHVSDKGGKYLGECVAFQNELAVIRDSVRTFHFGINDIRPWIGTSQSKSNNAFPNSSTPSPRTPGTIQSPFLHQSINDIRKQQVMNSSKLSRDSLRRKFQKISFDCTSTRSRTLPVSLTKNMNQHAYTYPDCKTSVTSFLAKLCEHFPGDMFSNYVDIIRRFGCEPTYDHARRAEWVHAIESTYSMYDNPHDVADFVDDMILDMLINFTSGTTKRAINGLRGERRTGANAIAIIRRHGLESFTPARISSIIQEICFFEWKEEFSCDVVEMMMDEKLLEISGHTFANGKSCTPILN